MKRREFITLPAKSLGGVLLYTLAGEPIRIQAQTGDARIPLRFFTAAEARVVEAACDRIFPSDENGPGAKEAGVVIFIDRQLAGPYGKDKYRYTKPPFVDSPADRDQRLRSIEKTQFFRLLRQHTIEGMFSDPLHGGNAGLIGWQLIGYPGPLMSYREEIDKFHGIPFRRKPVSLAQLAGRPVTGWEEEKD